MVAPLLVPAVSLVAEFIPDLLRLFKNDKAAEVAEKVGELAKKVTGKEEISEASEMIRADPEMAVKFKELILNNQLELEKLSIERERLYVSDVQDARKYRDERTFWLGVAVMLTFLITVILVLYGAYGIVVGVVEIDAALFAAVSGLIGTIVGYVAANAQAVINYFFGSSHGSMMKSDEMADSIKHFGK